MKNIVLSNHKSKDYTLIARLNEDDTVHEYVVAWHFEADGTWGQGHYFTELKDAMDFMYHAETIKDVIGVMKYVDEALEVDTDFKDIEEEMLVELVVEGLTYNHCEMMVM